MKNLIIPLVAGLLATPVVTFAQGDLSRADVQKVVLEMGSNDDGMYFSPNDFRFETGQAYNLVLVNVDDIKHEVSLNEMTERIFTRKIEVEAENGDLIVEIKGAIHEVEIGPHQTAQWFFVPVQTTESVQISCEIPGHKEAGMVGTAEIY
jgi:uncharacterized cupredoxin-like copper-binding protein